MILTRIFAFYIIAPGRVWLGAFYFMQLSDTKKLAWHRICRVEHNPPLLDKMKIVFKYIKPYRSRLIAVALMHALATFASLLMPYTMSLIIDEGIAKKNVKMIYISAALMLLFAGLSLISSIISNRLNARVATGFTSDLQRATFKRINALSTEQFSKIGSSGLLTRSTDDIFNLEGAASELVYTLVTVPIMLIGGCLLSFVHDPILSLIFLVSVPPVIVFIVFLVKPLGDMWDKADKYIDEQNRIVRERLSGLRVVRAFNNEEREHTRAKHATEEMSKYIIKSNVRSGYIEPIAMLLLNLATVIIIWVSRTRVEGGVLERAGDIVAVIQYLTLISNAILMLSWTIAWLPKLKVSAKRVGEIFDMDVLDVGADDVAEGGFADKFALPINISKLNFTYPDASAPSLYDVSLNIESGECVAIIGGTGSGKSTLVKLLLGFYDASDGDISIGGKSYSELGKRDIRSAYSVTLQKGMIFEGTVRDNINMGRRSASDDEILKSAEDVELLNFINSHGEGLSYILVGSGQNISGGQKQRCNMARCLIKEAPIYIFDDSFSALDYLTEKKIREKLNSRLRGKTVITVTQRISTALYADKIFVMDKGRTVGAGTHRELMKACPTYREIALSQLGKHAIGGDLDE